MAFLGSILRSRRGDFNLFLIAALVALLVLPGASGAVIAPQGAEAVLFWLQSEVASADVATPLSESLRGSSTLLAISHQQAESAPQHRAEIQLSAATFHCGQYLALIPQKIQVETPIAFATPLLERHVLARLSGVRTNRRLI
ncbi:hypothetical protein B1R32_106131 [Abditibacterium utsteinense]|uniref:Uncharacterized protein n=1 Tax=Abditibacterium utsteinense TaxID=1960156 RepID=A0A2S8SU20_9BACT|nr:hypothetical protein [Abditibacterium utsteinense]PQV64285.1 hypothetical protein B1R32_106131 [Abditibacterium utsteinense]